MTAAAVWNAAMGHAAEAGEPDTFDAIADVLAEDLARALEALHAFVVCADEGIQPQTEFLTVEWARALLDRYPTEATSG